jgi:hypothetical protein
MNEMESAANKVKTRRKWLAGIGFLSLFPLFKSGIFSKKNAAISCPPPAEKKETMKLLSRDGQLVEVDVSRIKQIKEKISDQELQNWIKKK